MVFSVASFIPVDTCIVSELLNVSTIQVSVHCIFTVMISISEIVVLLKVDAVALGMSRPFFCH